MNLTPPKGKRPKLKHVFTDVDGTRYFQDDRGDIVNKHGELVSLTQESNIRSRLGLW